MSSNVSTLFFSNATSNIINGILNETLTQDNITDNLKSNNIIDITGITIGTDVEKLEDYLFSDCFNLSNIVIYNTDILTYIGSHIFDDVSSNGKYSFYSKHATNNNTTPTTYYYTQNVERLINLLPNGWNTDLIYNYYTDFGVLCNEVIRINKSNVEYYDFEPIDISYNDFHSLFFAKNGYFTISPYNYLKINITTDNINRYTIINNQTLQTYYNNDLTKNPIDLSFNLYSTVLNHYQYSIPYQGWSIESTIQMNKQLSKLKKISDFGNYNSCTNTTCSDTKCNTSCNTKNNTKLTLDDMFNIFEAQGILMATDNSFNSVPILAKGLPINAQTEKYIAILNLYLRSNNSNVKDISLRMPYRINFVNSMPKNNNLNINNYRYNPSYIS